MKILVHSFDDGLREFREQKRPKVLGLYNWS